MARDWSGRAAAIAYFEKATKSLKRLGDSDVQMFEEALSALRRSQDHTAIQTRLHHALGVLRELEKYLGRSAAEAIHSGSAYHQEIRRAVFGKREASQLSESAYGPVMDRIERLVTADPAKDSPEGVELNLLAELAGHYERLLFPDLKGTSCDEPSRG